MESYREMLLCACNQIYCSIKTLGIIALELSLLDELKDVDGWLDEGEVIPLEVFDNSNDPLIQKLAAAIRNGNEVLETVYIINAFTHGEIEQTIETELSDKHEKTEVVNREFFLSMLVNYHYAETVKIGFYLGEMNIINGHLEEKNDYGVFPYWEDEFYGDENTRVIALFCRKMDFLKNYVEENMPGHTVNRPSNK